MVKRTYESDAIRVVWDSKRCIHVGRCLRGLPAVFDAGKRPWINASAAAADDIAAIVESCPSGALLYERLDGGPQEELPATPEIVPRANGPLMVRGVVRVQTAAGEVFTESGRMTLCRCGASANQPFCDNSHRSVRFRDNPRVISSQREEARNPLDIDPEPQPGA